MRVIQFRNTHVIKLLRAYGGCLGAKEPMKDVVDCEKLRGAVSKR